MNEPRVIGRAGEEYLRCPPLHSAKVLHIHLSGHSIQGQLKGDKNTGVSIHLVSEMSNYAHESNTDNEETGDSGQKCIQPNHTGTLLQGRC